MSFIGTVLQEQVPVIWLIVFIGGLTALAVLNHILSIAEKLPGFWKKRARRGATKHCDDQCACKAELRNAKVSAERQTEIVKARADGLEAHLASLEGSLRKLQGEAKENVSGKIGITAEELAELSRFDRGSSA